MAKIRDDMEGVVYLADGTMLSAGDSVPEGVEVGDHLTSSDGPKSEGATKARKTTAAKGHGDNAAG